MAALTAQVIPHAGAAVTLTAGLGGVNGHTAPCGAGLGLLLVNGTAATCNVDILTASNVGVDGMPVATPASATGPARRFVLPATSGAVAIIPLQQAVYADPVTGLASFNVAAGTVSGAVVSISA